jgi:hypothetical protein
VRFTCPARSQRETAQADDELLYDESIPFATDLLYPRIRPRPRRPKFPTP